MAYITARRLLELLPAGRAARRQRPGRGAECARKAFRAQVQGSDAADAVVARRQRNPRLPGKSAANVILKPLFGNGGAGIVHLRPGNENLIRSSTGYAQINREPVMVQRYVPEVGATSALSSSTASRAARCARAGRRRGAGQPPCRRPGGEDDPDRARGRNLRRDRPEPQGAGADLCRGRRVRRLHTEDGQRHLADRHPGDRPARRHQSRRGYLGRDRGAPYARRSA